LYTFFANIVHEKLEWLNHLQKAQEYGQNNPTINDLYEIKEENRPPTVKKRRSLKSSLKRLSLAIRDDEVEKDKEDEKTVDEEKKRKN